MIKFSMIQFGVIFLISSGVTFAWNTLDGKPPVLFGHQGDKVLTNMIINNKLPINFKYFIKQGFNAGAHSRLLLPRGSSRRLIHRSLFNKLVNYLLQFPSIRT